MTKVTIGKRGTGKTTKLIQRSAREGVYILTSTVFRAQAIWDTAREMGLNIPYPVTLHEYLHSNKFRSSTIPRKGILIDDVDAVVGALFAGIPIHEVTMTDYGNIERLSMISNNQAEDMLIKIIEANAETKTEEDSKKQVVVSLMNDALRKGLNALQNMDRCGFHDLTIDPTDLPEKYGEDWVLVKIDTCGLHSKPMLAEYRDGKWYTNDKEDSCLDDFCKVIGWFKIYDPSGER